MKPIDFVAPIFGLLWAIVTFILLKRNNSKPNTWAHILGIGIGVYGFLSYMTGSILRRPISEFLDYTITSLFLSLPLGIIGYLTGRAYARRRENKK